MTEGERERDREKDTDSEAKKRETESKINSEHKNVGKELWRMMNGLKDGSMK